jgi:hypothetical protein
MAENNQKNKILLKIWRQNKKVLKQNKKVSEQNDEILSMLRKTETGELYRDVQEEVTEESPEYEIIESEEAQEAQEAEKEEEAEVVHETRKIKRIVKKAKKRLEDFIVACPEQESYTPEEVKMLLAEDYNLIAEWIRIKGLSELYCTHCKKAKNVAHYWASEIRNCCQKHGLNPDTKVPKTCDQRQRENRMCNGANNKVYPLLRNERVSEESKRELLKKKQEIFSKIGINIAPTKYAKYYN